MVRISYCYCTFVTCVTFLSQATIVKDLGEPTYHQQVVDKNSNRGK